MKIKYVSKNILYVLTVVACLLLAGCSLSKTDAGVKPPKEKPPEQGKKISLTVYMSGLAKDTANPLPVPVQREIVLTGEDTVKFRMRAALEELIKGPSDKEKEEGLTSSLPKEVKVLNVGVKRPYVTVDFSSELQGIGGTMMIDSLLDQIKYTLTEFDGIAGVILQVNGEQVGTEANPFTGDGFQFNALARPAEAAWAKDISPTRALDNFIVSIGNGEVKEMWLWMGPGIRGQYEKPEKINLSELAEGLGAWRNYQVVSEVVNGDKAVVIIKGDQKLEGMTEKDAQYTAYMIKENGQWKWDPRSK